MANGWVGGSKHEVAETYYSSNGSTLAGMPCPSCGVPLAPKPGLEHRGLCPSEGLQFDWGGWPYGLLTYKESVSRDP